jgi:hypothetical protein
LRFACFPTAGILSGRSEACLHYAWSFRDTNQQAFAVTPLALLNSLSLLLVARGWRQVLQGRSSSIWRSSRSFRAGLSCLCGDPILANSLLFGPVCASVVSRRVDLRARPLGHFLGYRACTHRPRTIWGTQKLGPPQSNPHQVPKALYNRQVKRYLRVAAGETHSLFPQIWGMHTSS